MSVRRFQRLLLLALVGGGSVLADEITFSLSTTGSFSAGTPSRLTFDGIGSLWAGIPGLTGTTTGGLLALNDLGRFELEKRDDSRAADNYQSTFTLTVWFFSPTGITGQKTSFSAAVDGVVNSQQGSVFIDFGPAKHITFDDGIRSGSFDLAINDIWLNIPHDDTESVEEALTGSISNAVDPVRGEAPEPLSIALLGTAILLLVGLIRRRAASLPGAAG